MILSVLLAVLAAGACSNPAPEPTSAAPEGAATEGWQEVEAPGRTSQPGFSLKLPRGWDLIERQGIDSYVGEIAGDGVSLHFDYGSYSWNLNPEDDPEHEYNVAYEKIGGVEAKLVWPKGSSRGFTGVYFGDLGGPRLSIYGEDLTQEQQRTGLAIFRNVQSLE